MQKTMNKKNGNSTDDMMQGILKHANPEWRAQRSVIVQALDPKNTKQDEEGNGSTPN